MNSRKIDAIFKTTPTWSSCGMPQKTYSQLQNYIFPLVYLFDSIITDNSCLNLTDNTAHYGLKIVLQYFVDELKVLYYRYELLLTLRAYFNFTYNMTTMGYPTLEALYLPEKTENMTEAEYKHVLKLYNISHPITIFNLEYNKKLHFIYRFILGNTLLSFHYMLQDVAQQAYNIHIKYYYLMESTVGVFFFLMYVFVWKGYEMQIEESIYKTKKMLSIIPAECLMKVNNIAKLLNIDTSEEGNKQKTSFYWN